MIDGARERGREEASGGGVERGREGARGREQRRQGNFKRGILRRALASIVHYQLFQNTLRACAAVHTLAPTKVHALVSRRSHICHDS